MDKTPNAALIVIGNEILSGRTADKNINHTAKILGEIGVRFMEVRVIPDVESTIIETVNEVRAKFDYVFTTGGIGPTHDDITTESIAKAFRVKLVKHPEALKRLSDYYKGELNEGRTKMAILPEGAGLIDNPISVAPGFYIGNVYVMAGIPNVMQAMMDSIKHSLKGGAIMLSKEMVIYSSESKIATPLRELQNRTPDVEIGSYPFVKDLRFGTALVLRSTDKQTLENTYNELEGILGEMGIKIEK
jgi:molybdenum cofactor synthesis domain-containing protein